MRDQITIRGARGKQPEKCGRDAAAGSAGGLHGPVRLGQILLAFDTIYAEGQRRYVESLSSYARMFLGQMDKPDVDSIDGLSPAISIDQKTTSKNPRSTVGTVTEIYDYLRLLWARAGTPHCPKCGREIEKQTSTRLWIRFCGCRRAPAFKFSPPWSGAKRASTRRCLKMPAKAVSPASGGRQPL